MLPFEFVVPYSLEEALSLLSPDDPEVRPVGGATAIMLMMKAGVLSPSRLVSLRNIEARYSSTRINEKGELVIGGLARLKDLEHNSDVRRGWPMLTRALRTHSNVRVRAVATVGGNLAHADPHMDLPPVMAALGARITIAGARSGLRTVPADSFCTGYYETVLARDELIVGVTVPPQPSAGTYMKITTRAAHDWPALGLALVFDNEGGHVRRPSIMAGAATDRPTRLAAAQRVLEGVSVDDDEALERAGDAAAQEIDIVGDTHGSAAYKRHLLKVTLTRAVRLAANTARTAQ
ncbi:FAD binding domain-containing protein [Bordetella genomosp. 13]|uniref:Molybdopterin dehydrogenase n=1 Tax=Bordetella genomosp. 13 TaxID=463040 RepID=A0A1W6ZGM7_9BORD|nr:FAD binding domain-containing protein [Bordetella genomosp. 13]ARP96558.1 molybdopterin dehydrogenase [Bordetella genomosp. 13]